MRVEETDLPGVLVIEPRVFQDQRGHFLESWNRRRYEDLGILGEFVQDNVSLSKRAVLRGLHYQWPHPQGKLVSVLQGEVWDVAVDLRRDSETFGQWYGCVLSAENARQMWIPEGFAHGFVVLSEEALVSYKCTDYYHPEAEHTLLWNDPELAIPWPVDTPTLSDKDRAGMRLAQVTLNQPSGPSRQQRRA